MHENLPVTAIAVRAFSQCTSIISIEIPDSVTEIGSQAFYQCPNLQRAVLPAKLTDIGTYLFYECTSLSWKQSASNLTVTCTDGTLTAEEA